MGHRNPWTLASDGLSKHLLPPHSKCLESGDAINPVKQSSKAYLVEGICVWFLSRISVSLKVMWKVLAFSWASGICHLSWKQPKERDIQESLFACALKKTEFGEEKN